METTFKFQNSQNVFVKSTGEMDRSLQKIN